jgi:hypothetical protein
MENDPIEPKNIEGETETERQEFFHFIAWLMALGLTETYISEAFDVSVLTARRWMAGESAPQPAMRSRVMEKLGSISLDQNTE